MKSANRYNPQRTQIKRLELYHDRWTGFGTTSGIIGFSDKLSPDDLRRFDIFSDLSDSFLEEISPDISLAKWQKGAVLFEQGSYIDLAFYVVQGKVEVSLRQARGDKRRDQQAIPRNGKSKSALSKGAKVVFLATMDFNLPANRSQILGRGEYFGEIGAVNGWPQSVTARMASDGVLLQIRVPALRRLKRKAKGLKERLDAEYRKRSLISQLRAIPMLRECDRPFIESLARRVELVSFEPGEAIVREGEAPEAFFIVRSGFVKLTQHFGEGDLVVSYLSKGMTCGEAEFLIDGTSGWLHTASSVEYTDLIKISREDFLALVKKYPGVQRRLSEIAVARVKASGYSKRNISHSEFIHTGLEKGLLEGNSILVIDLDRCTRCDDCVRGCADTHGGHPRFVREGDKYDNLLITKSCYHCRDPICLIGCPTGAIRRASVGHVVEIKDDLCIGCKACANNCPYDAIIMHETGERWPEDTLPEALRGQPRLLASKCDLCYQTNHQPACVSNCPHGCAVRIGSMKEFQKLLTIGK